MPLRPVATTRAGPRVVSVGITHPVTKTARHIFRMERKAKTKANHDAEEDAVNMEAKGSTWQGLQPSTCSRFLKKLEMRSKSFMAGPREGRGKLGRPCFYPLPETNHVVEGNAAVGEQHGRQRAATR